MSARKGVPQTSHRPPLVRPNVAWQEFAVCGPEHAELMTAETKPARSTLARLEAVCRSCPVARECAAYGLHTRGVGMFGGVWVGDRGPHRTSGIERLRMRAS